MINQTASRLLDTSAWLSYYFAENDTARHIIESDILLFVSLLSYYELRKKLTKEGYKNTQVDEFCEFIQSRATSVILDYSIVTDAVELSLHHKLGAIDALILASSRSVNAVLVTGDNDFRGFPHVEMIQ